MTKLSKFRLSSASHQETWNSTETIFL